MSVMFVECEGGRFVNLAHVAVIELLPAPSNAGVPRWRLLGPDKASLGICEAGSVDELLQFVIPVPNEPFGRVPEPVP
jgi:hypothetical protein